MEIRFHMSVYLCKCALLLPHSRASYCQTARLFQPRALRRETAGVRAVSPVPRWRASLVEYFESFAERSAYPVVLSTRVKYIPSICILYVFSRQHTTHIASPRRAGQTVIVKGDELKIDELVAAERGEWRDYNDIVLTSITAFL